MSNAPIASSTPDYTMGYSEEYLRFLTRDRESQKIARLLPLLRPGQRVLDLGCGPGQVTVALAQAVAPGETWAIDIELSQVAQARVMASEHHCANVRFETADAANLPVADSSFDIVVCCDLLAYVPDVSRVLAEARRVLRPGGIIFCREMVIDSCFAYPSDTVIDRGWQIFADLLESDEGHPQMGKELGVQLRDCGFIDVSHEMVFDTFAEPGEVTQFSRFVTGWFLSPEISQAAQQYGVEEEHEVRRLLRQMEVWQATPGAVAAIAFGLALATKP